jgi:integrase
MIEIIDKHKAKLIVNIGSGEKRKRRTKTVAYEKKRDLQKMYVDFERECLRRQDTRDTVEEVLDAYIESRKRLGIKATTTRGYENCKSRLSTAIKEEIAAEVTPYLIDKFISDNADKWSPKTIRNTISVLSSAYDRAIHLGLLTDNPCRRVTLPKNTKKEVDIFNEENVGKFLRALDKERLDFKVAYELALLCGLRRSEILGLREEHISIPFKAVTVAETRHRVSDSEIVQDTKTATSHRVLALPESLAEDIDVLIKEHHAFEYDHTDYLIQDGFGQPMNPSTLSNHIYKIEADNGLPHVSLHDLRHTFASMLNNAHIDIARISRELGHSNVNTTLGIYTHVFNGITESSRGIADTIESKVVKSATFLPPEAKEKTSER